MDGPRIDAGISNRGSMATIMHATNKIAIGDATHNRSHGVIETTHLFRVG